jgi:hypothetical protein
MEKEPLSFGLPKVEPLSITDVLSQSTLVAQQDMVQAELAPPTSISALGFAQQEAVARGYLRHFTSKLNPADPTTSDVLKIVNGAIRSQDFNTLRKVSPELASVLSIYAGNPVAFDKYNTFAKEVLQGQITIAESTSQLAKAESDAVSAQTVVGILSDTPNIANNVYRNAFSLQGLGGYVKNIGSEVQSIRAQAATETDEKIRSAMLDRANVVEDSLIRGAVGNALRDLTPEQVSQLRGTLATGSTEYIDGLPSSVRANFFVIEQSFTSADQRSKIDNLMAEYASGPAKFIEDNVQRNAQKEADEFVSSQLPKLINLRSVNDITTAVETLNEILSTIGGLSDGDRKTTEERILVEGGRAALNIAFGQASNEDQVQAIASYIRTGDAGSLPASITDAADKAREYAALIDDKGFLDSVTNTFALQRQRDIEVAAKELSKIRSMNLAVTGQANPDTEEGRAAASGVVLSDINSAITRTGAAPISQMPIDFFTNPAYANDQRFSQAFTRVYDTQNLMPAELQTAFQAVADGNLNITGGFNYKTVLSHYEKMRLIEGPTGSIPNPALDALSLEQRGILNFLLDAPTVLGQEADIGSMFSSARQLQLKEDYPKAAERFLGDVKLDEWLVSSVDSYGLLNASEQASIKALSNFMIAQSLSTSGMSMTEKSLARAVNRQMDEWFPDGGGKVIQIDHNGMPSRRTKYALSKTVGTDEDDFTVFALSEVSRYAAKGFTARSFYSRSANSFAPTIAATVLGVQGTQALFDSLGMQSTKPYLELVAAGPDSFGGVSYYVHEFDPRTGIRKMVQRNDNKGALIISTREPSFASRVEAKRAAEKAERDRRAELGKLIYEDLQNNIPVMP